MSILFSNQNICKHKKKSCLPLNNQTSTMLISTAVKEIKVQNTGKDNCTREPMPALPGYIKPA